MRLKDTIYGSTLIVISIFVFAIGSGFPNYVVRGKELPGPKFFPFLIAYLLIFAGIYFIIRSLLRWNRTEGINTSDLVTKRGIIRVISIVAGVLLYVPLINLIGFKVGTFILCAVFMYMLGVKLLKSLIYSLILTIVIILIFGMVFSIPFPQGFLPF
ncbi:tripartite tricarboxylate transporter TctB family protein [Kosmotoga pacifica]|uniref:DUF1468 domain-containing protein n=1 Tax=Kosmotoga pacifica TaxID=1330330 RepID=A0A0G2ZG20_9BACT|nr:tripartite tricarboxylate transporter TctB family protein [Kosmotoga pacifica]AKI97763.1 hypothetical protein IX53_07990 [Kosmotoga pacifica]